LEKIYMSYVGFSAYATLLLHKHRNLAAGICYLILGKSDKLEILSIQEGMSG